MSILQLLNGKLVLNGEKAVSGPDLSLQKPLYFTANTAGSTVELIKVGSPNIANTAYSLDGQTWTTFTPSATAGTNTITLSNVGDKVYFKNNITVNFSSSKYLKFVMTGKISASGNVNSMYAATSFDSITSLTYNCCYFNLFSGCTRLTTAPALPATTLVSGCYKQMFFYCPSLQVSDTQTTDAPYQWKMPTTGTFTNTYSQTGMFQNCAGTRSSDNMAGASGQSYTYYTQNEPVS